MPCLPCYHTITNHEARKNMVLTIKICLKIMRIMMMMKMLKAFEKREGGGGSYHFTNKQLSEENPLCRHLMMIMMITMMLVWWAKQLQSCSKDDAEKYNRSTSWRFLGWYDGNKNNLAFDIVITTIVSMLDLWLIKLLKLGSSHCTSGEPNVERGLVWSFVEQQGDNSNWSTNSVPTYNCHHQHCEGENA